MEASQNKEPALYRDVLKRAWSIVMGSKFMLIFGLFAALAANGEQYDILHKNISSITNLQQILPILDTSQITNALGQFWDYVRLLLIQGSFLDTENFDAVILFVAVIIGPIIVAEIALIAATNRAVAKGEKPGFGESFRDTGKFFLPVLTLNIAAKAIVYGLLIIISYPIFMRFMNSGGSKSSIDALAVTAFIMLVPVQIILSFLTKFASAYVVIMRKSLGQAIAAAWQLFVKHWLVAVEMSFILIFFNVLAAILVLGGLALTLGVPPDGEFSAIVFYVVILTFGALIAAFQYAAWVTLFLKLKDNQGVSKLARWADMLYKTLGAKKSTAIK